MNAPTARRVALELAAKLLSESLRNCDFGELPLADERRVRKALEALAFDLARRAKRPVRKPRPRKGGSP